MTSACLQRVFNDINAPCQISTLKVTLAAKGIVEIRLQLRYPKTSATFLVIEHATLLLQDVLKVALAAKGIVGIRQLRHPKTSATFFVIEHATLLLRDVEENPSVYIANYRALRVGY